MFKNVLSRRGKVQSDSDTAPDIVKKYRRDALLRGRSDTFHSSGAMDLDVENMFVDHEQTHQAIAKLIKLGNG